MSQQTTPARSRTTRARSRVIANIVRGCLGNLVEWYDWFVYASFSIYFAQVFFPEGDQTAQLLSTAVVFAVGFFMRPLGGWLLGLYGDRFGRRAALTLSVTLMSVGSLTIAVTPSYQTIGLAAPVLLVVARLAQGLSVGGEFGSSASYLSEIAPSGRRGFYSSFNYVSIVLGQLSALAVMIVLQSVLDEEQMGQWGWRVPFAIGAVAGLVVMYLRRSMEESEHYKRDRLRRSAPEAAGERRGLFALLTEYPLQVIAVLGFAIGGTVAFYTFTTYLQKYLVNTAGIPKPTASLINFAALFVFMLLQPAAGALSDRIGRRPVMFVFSVGGMLITVPVMTVLGQTRNPWVAFLLMTGALVFVSGYAALSSIIKAEMFPTKVRALGVGLCHALVTATFGGMTESVALVLKQSGRESTFFWYVTGCIALTFVATLLVREPSRESTLDGEDTASERASARDDEQVTSPMER
ncbi:MHS family alpha-ketoglutarate permease-like MFS transporter [Saccharopolyspora erythraea NRRL 2338]|uniref:MFS transporter n=2 Tax=Saccharopolyspora erythraea TaxID=1836 RepID=A0ABN1CSZ1_SACER|nr:MFS transporter [Saccharopolyspora erythraea]EQD87865.1 major facilitator transporter [Saccharopolyspora erythraea D]PFG97528.1 MHS family alpha-ketoglutarate permease-like MFS transporter [Saccharopolyspora erythraea NRRL 2338]QRK87702.1 MFS transporter [Saccharopolyspora erythraea]CAM03852.1 alpha-ketoglutarate transporter, MFS superfamily [Saccharopolyspora erythraea NRRL 2338]